MAYASWSVSFGEQPSASKWNILGTNDASFNDGTGIATNAIAASSLATSAITLGYAASTSTFTATPGSDTYANVTSLSAAVTVPLGGRRILVTAFAPSINGASAAGQTTTFAIREGTTELGKSVAQIPVTSYNVPAICYYSATGVSAGAHTYLVSVKTSSTGAINIANVSATAPSFILVQVI